MVGDKMDYLYDETFEGLLTCLYANYYDEVASGIYSQFVYQENFLRPNKKIITDEEKAEKVAAGIRKKISSEAFEHIYNVFLSNDPAKENKILKYVIYGFKVGKKIDAYHTHEVVLPVHKLSKQVSYETHRFTGLLRFMEVGTVLYAAFEPDHYILPKLADHFIERFKNENLLIHDTKRNLALAYNKKEWNIWEYTLSNEIPLSENERHFQALWQGYFDHIGIETRKNEGLQQQFVPLKYRKHLTEFKSMDKE